MQWTIQKLLQWATEYFHQKGIATSRLDSELLLSHVLGLERIQLYTQWDRPLEDSELQAFKALLKRRAAREPLAYLLGTREFFSLSFHVTPAVLVPRPETEAIVEQGLEHLKSISVTSPKILDLATGSGCILISLLKKFPSAQGVGVDCSGDALQVSKKNADHHQVAERVQWTEQDLSAPWSFEIEKPFDLITANLPYVSQAEYQTLQPEIRDYEPKLALVPGPKGTEAFDWVLPNLATHLSPNGLVLLEIGADQGACLLEKARELCPEFKAVLHQDLSGQDRVLSLKPRG